MSNNIVTIVRNATDTQVEINGREVPDVIEVTEVKGINGGHKVALIFLAAQVNTIGENAKRDPVPGGYVIIPGKPTRWQRFKAWWRGVEDAFENWQNSEYKGDDY